MMKDKYTHTFKNLSRLIDLDPHLAHIAVAKASVWGVAPFKATATGLEIIRSSQAVSIEAGEELAS